jgi:hypothetical protein
LFPNQTDAFAVPAQYTIGTSGRNILRGDNLTQFDVSLLKDIVIKEEKRVQFRAEFFNIANHAQFSKVDGNITDGVDFGRVTRARDPRLVQFALKLFF